jgi:hypothetical protein
MRAMPDLSETASAPGSLPAWRRVFGFALDPGGAVRAQLGAVSITQALAIPAAAFALFFLQTGLDRARTGTLDGAGVGILVLAGLAFGTIGLAAIAVLGWGAIRALGGTAGFDTALRAFALSYCPTLISVLLGLAFSLALGWNTAIAFGVSGVLWALGPMSGAIREMLGGRLWPAIAVSSLCGLAVLYAWAMLEALV